MTWLKTQGPDWHHCHLPGVFERRAMRCRYLDQWQCDDCARVWVWDGDLYGCFWKAAP